MKKEYIISILLLLAFYLAIPSYNYSDESVHMAMELEKTAYEGEAMDLFNAHSPFLKVFMYGFYELARTVSPELSAMSFLRGFNLVIGIFTLIIFFLFLQLTTLNPKASIFATFFLGLNYVFWYSSHDGGGKIFALFAALVFVFLLFKLHRNIPSLVYHIIIGIVFGIVLLIDIAAILFIIPIFLYNPYGKEYQFSMKVIALAVALGVVVIGLGIYYTTLPMDELREYGDYLLTKLKTDVYSGALDSHFNLNFKAALLPFTFTAEGLIGGSGGLSLIIKVLSSLALLTLIIIIIVKWRDVGTAEKDLVNFSFAWFIPMLLLFPLWAAANNMFSILWMPAFGILLGEAIFAGKWITLNRVSTGIGVALLLILLCGNLAVSILPNSRVESNEDLNRAKLIAGEMEKNDAMLFFETEQESGKDLFFRYYIPLEAKRASFTIDWRPQYRVPVGRINEEIDRLLDSGANLYLLIRNDVEGGMTILEFMERFPRFQTEVAEDLDDKYTLFRLY